MEIRKTKLKDLETAMALYDQGRQFMRQKGNHSQWVNGYPARALIEEDIRLGRSYLAEEGGAPAAVFYFCHGVEAEPCYTVIDGAWLDDGPYGVLHRIASNGKARGTVATCADWCLAQCPSLRIDTHWDNLPMQQALIRCGFQYCGVVVIEDGTKRMAYQEVR